jgi:hypothetical protein
MVGWLKRRLGDAVIHNQHQSNMSIPDLDIVLPFSGSLERLLAIQNLPPFGFRQLEFAAALARELTTSSKIRSFPELVSLGFWLRTSNLRRMIDAFNLQKGCSINLPRGLVFHIAPSNVDAIFVYSWLISLLCGNRNIVRISSKETTQTSLLLATLNGLLQQSKWDDIAQRTLIIRYGHDPEISAALSAFCDLRVIWGGDETIRAFRSFPLNPRATELAFANKFSLSVLDANLVATAQEETIKKLVSDFHNDAYWYGQMACSSPKMVLWRGCAVDVDLATQRFWPALQLELSNRKVKVEPADNMNKEVMADALAIEGVAERIFTPASTITRIWMSKPKLHEDMHCGAGLFYEARVNSLDSLSPLLSRKVQTIGYFGVTENDWREFVVNQIPAGIDRIVPIGQALDFEPIWDGFDLFLAFQRQLSIK